jgi:hypothetical protein
MTGHEARRAGAVAVLFWCAAGMAMGEDAAPNRLTPAEQKEGWRLLFDGKTPAGWRGFKQPEFPANRWLVEDGCIRRTGDGGGRRTADIITVDTFTDYELSLEWRVAKAGNSGVKYLVTEEREGPVAHEYQILDDDNHPDGKVGPHRHTAAFYDVLPPAKGKPLRPVGEWNQSRLLVQGNHVEHWLNGQKVLEYELGSPELKAAIVKSKFKDVAGFGDKIPGHILLQDHGDDVSFRSIKVRSLAK